MTRPLPSARVSRPPRRPGPAWPLPQPPAAALPARRAEGSRPGQRHLAHKAGSLLLPARRRPVQGQQSGSIASRKRKAAGALWRAGEELPPPAASPREGLLARRRGPTRAPGGPGQAPLRSGRWPRSGQALPAAWEGGRRSGSGPGRARISRAAGPRVSVPAAEGAWRRGQRVLSADTTSLRGWPFPARQLLGPLGFGCCGKLCFFGLVGWLGFF